MTLMVKMIRPGILLLLPLYSRVRSPDQTYIVSKRKARYLIELKNSNLIRSELVVNEEI